MKSEFQLDARLRADCVELALVNGIHVLLLDNALAPWFVLVPQTDATELHDLSPTLRAYLHALQDTTGRFVLAHFDVQKLNIAAIGNVVSQMHIHVIGRAPGDYCWPGVTWGRAEKLSYTESAVAEIREKLRAYL